MNGFHLPIGDVVETAVDWMISNLDWFFSALGTGIRTMYEGPYWVLSTPPFWIIILAFALVAFLLRGVGLAVGTAAALLVVVGVGQWDNAMVSLSLVIVAAAIALVIGIPVGIWAARNDVVSKIVRPVLDFLQTMPAFVYLIPAIMLFRVGVVPGIVATIAFAIAPAVRLTELGIRGVDREVVEAGRAFGATPGRILRQVQLPLALPSIMAGVNQVIMLSLSMVVIAGMVGAGGLGRDVVASLTSLNIGLGAEAGLSVVLIAVILDRMTSALTAGQRPSLVRRLFVGERKKKPAPDASGPDESAEEAAAEPTTRKEAAAAR